jgi:small subunit ribosomal protein S8
MNDHLSDFATRIRNAYLVGKSEVVMPHTQLLASVAKVLVDHKYLSQAKTKKEGNKQQLVLSLNYSGRKPALSQIKRVSKPGVRIYSKSSELYPVLSGLGIKIVSTSSGVMTGQQARKNKLGGEVLLELW